MALLDNEEDREAVLSKFDAGLHRLRDSYREYGYDWEKSMSDRHQFSSWED